MTTFDDLKDIEIQIQNKQVNYKKIRYMNSMKAYLIKCFTT